MSNQSPKSSILVIDGSAYIHRARYNTEKWETVNDHSKSEMERVGTIITKAAIQWIGINSKYVLASDTIVTLDTSASIPPMYGDPIHDPSNCMSPKSEHDGENAPLAKAEYELSLTESEKQQLHVNQRVINLKSIVGSVDYDGKGRENESEVDARVKVARAKEKVIMDRYIESGKSYGDARSLAIEEMKGTDDDMKAICTSRFYLQAMNHAKKLLMKILPSLNITCIPSAGIGEADDIVAWISYNYMGKILKSTNSVSEFSDKYHIYMFTRDKDWKLLVSPDCTWVDYSKYNNKKGVIGETDDNGEIVFSSGSFYNWKLVNEDMISRIDEAQDYSKKKGWENEIQHSHFEVMEEWEKREYCQTVFLMEKCLCSDPSDGIDGIVGFKAVLGRRYSLKMVSYLGGFLPSISRLKELDGLGDKLSGRILVKENLERIVRNYNLMDLRYVNDVELFKSDVHKSRLIPCRKRVNPRVLDDLTWAAVSNELKNPKGMNPSKERLRDYTNRKIIFEENISMRSQDT